MKKVLVVATSRKTRGGITSVVKAHETGEQWKKYHCRWIQTHRDGPTWRKIGYLLTALIEYIVLLPFYDIVHIHAAAGPSARRKLAFAKVAKLFGRKIIVHFHPSSEKTLYGKSGLPLKRLFGYSDVILVLAPQWGRWINEAFPNNSYNMRILYNPCPTVNRNSLFKKKQILYAGTILKRKGYDVLIKAFGRIANKYPEWELIFAGNPYLKEGINELEDGKRLANELGITNQVRWLGWVTGIEKEKVFNGASIYCLASDGEGFPMGVLDAWSYGIPCVMTPVGGIPDIVKDGVQGLLFPIGDSIKMAEALDKMMRDENLRKYIISQTDILVSSTFNINSICQQLDGIYSSLKQ